MGIIEALVSFLGGTAFRMVWGEVSSWITKKQDHAHELESLRIQGMLEKDRHTRDMEKVQQAHELGIKEIQVQGDLGIQKLEADAFVAAMQQVNKPTGIQWVDAWNALVRPATATMCLLLWIGQFVAGGFMVDEWDISLIGVVLGFYFADRSLAKRSK
ncbi:hypothetical protein UFOVP1528_30 [uncultured Caudovirales phage]|uniref:Holin of 3TMs, for gene-transfer release n=1 Tax=uncultured Caudovirales phage TaxID=2100421 RepID=A0A6J5QEW7_9CAUD|nr:hypothetical protein UFOVP905_45 [uncultured Caudovirales phage]CAB4183019.1 hypothetical protein UFOVP1080_33 [uncultured Caudovirales phage]CAB4197427.1 hypothetical protein UFOVP1321_21 [uncultured Caudovirales phage]CAB4212835.1 hypothetical protein UFOVP1432_42 [uncultured Caudovirales phage]CAB5227358.1 hypothetical protein UFOVP1528_30 [uncultured Caudovirales phage]